MSQLVVGELLVRALQVHAGEQVLDVAGGAGNTAMAAARRWADATCTDFVPELLEHAAARAAVEGLPLRTLVADAQALPFPDNSFDVVTSTFGAMFAPDQERTAAELIRVLRPGGRLGLANWAPGSWVAEQFALQARYLPPPAGLTSPMAWGTPQRLDQLFAGRLSAIEITDDYMEFVLPSTAALLELFSESFGPVMAVLARLGAEEAAAFNQQWVDISDRHNIATDGTCDIPSPYLQVVAIKG
jgi:SAM-dependent methyltransferase